MIETEILILDSDNNILFKTAAKPKNHPIPFGRGYYLIIREVDNDE